MKIGYLPNLLDETNRKPAKPHLRNKVRKLIEIITYATSHAVGVEVKHRPVCGRILKGQSCSGVLNIDLRQEMDVIHWQCPDCGEEALLTGWSGLSWDISVRPALTRQSKA